MLKNVTKKLLLVSIMALGICVAFANEAFAINIMETTNTTLNQTTNSNTVQQINGIAPITNTTVAPTTNTVAPVNKVVPTVTNNTINNVKPNIDQSTYTNSDLPKTGVEDYPLVILMVACIGAAVYAYIKVRNYNSL